MARFGERLRLFRSLADDEGTAWSLDHLGWTGIVRDDLVTLEEVEPKVAKAVALADSSLSPVALLLSRDLLWEEPAA